MIGLAAAVSWSAYAETPPTSPSAPMRLPARTSSPTTRFSTFENACPQVQTAVAQARGIANYYRGNPLVAQSQIGAPSLPGAITPATNPMVQEGRVAPANILSVRQAALTRLRLTHTQVGRQQLRESLRMQAGHRMEEQREVARLVRDRLRELRDTTFLTPGPGN